ncbi:hypothetical protein ScPMuIL_003448 [Solemya velum]
MKDTVADKGTSAPAKNMLALVLVILISGTRQEEQEEQHHGIVGPVFISEPPNNAVFPNTEGLSVPCTAYGRPAPELEWVRADGRPVDDVEGLLHILPNNTLRFSAFESKEFTSDIHTGRYRCVAKNTAGIILSRPMKITTVMVDQYEEFSVELHDEWVMRGSAAVFECKVNPVFVKDYVRVVGWSIGSKDIVPGDRLRVLSDGRLYVRNVREEDGESQYRCTTENTLTGDRRSSSPANLHIHESPAGGAATVLNMESSSETVQEGGDAELPCVGNGYPLPKYRWYKDGKLTIPDDSRTSQIGGNLLIKNTTVGDTGFYVCNASNEISFASKTIYLIIMKNISVYVDPADQIVDAGEEATLNCTFSGHPVESIEWYKNGEVLKAKDKISFSSETILQIRNVSKLDEGMYQCMVSNDKEVVQSTSQLTLGAAQPVFLEKSVDQYAQKGQKAWVRCTASGNPVPEVAWIHDGQQLVPSAHVRVGSVALENGNVVSYVNISSVTIQDGGEYTCTADNGVGKVEYTAKLNVYGVPYVRPMKNITATADDPLSIRCYVAGYPVQKITWSRDTRLLPVNHLQRVSRGTLTITSVRRLDAGEYICAATNTEGQGMARSVFIDVVEPPVIDPFFFPRRNQGERIVVSCVVSSGDLPISIKWIKDGQPIPPDLGIVVKNLGPYSSLLSIGDASPMHDGNYTCHASNAAADRNYTTSLHIDVPPRWVKEPVDSAVVLYKSLRVDCLSAGTPTPAVTWEKSVGDIPGNYQPLKKQDDDSDPPRFAILDNGTLVISQTLETDHGYYLCHAKNGVGLGLSKVIFITVHVPARFDESARNYTVVKGQEVTMQCQAVGDKPLSISWSFNRISVSSDWQKRRTIETVSTSRGKLSHLTLRPSMRNDTGFYVCTAQNHFGDGVLGMRLTVFEPPEPPSNLKVGHVDSRWISLSWEKPYDGNSQIEVYTIQYKNKTDTWHQNMAIMVVTGNTLTTELSNLLPSFTYDIRVMVNNSIGYSAPSQTLSFTMMEEAPSGPPQDIKAKAVGSEGLLVTWSPPLLGYRNGVIKGYHVGYRETNSPAQYIYMTKIVDDSNLEIVIGNLRKFTSYVVHVKAYNDKGIGPMSPDFKVFTLEDVPSQPPQGVHAEALTSHSIRVEWTPPPMVTMHGILQGYKVLYKPVRQDEDESDARVVTSMDLEAVVDGLEKFSNYSLQVLAYTRKGEGVRSQIIYLMTQEDVPDQPADIKVVSLNDTSVVVSWRPPEMSNGVLVNYTLYYWISDNSSQQAVQSQTVSSNDTDIILTGLPSAVPINFNVSASTAVGEGPTSQTVTARAIQKAPAKISSFSVVLSVPWRHTVLMPCSAVGNPTPKIKWLVGGKAVKTDDRIEMLTNGSLFINYLVAEDSANYTCRAENEYGADSIIYTLSVQTAPRAPLLTLATTTISTIQVNWLSRGNGGSSILGFKIKYRKEHEGWMSVVSGRTNRTHTFAGLLCGTTYRFQILAFNKKGSSPESDVIITKTNGSVPILPPQSMQLKNINVTSVDLDLQTWLTEGCPILFFSIKYRVWGDDNWINVASNIKANTTIFTVQDLHPASWYVMKVTAISDAGSADTELQFATLTYKGSTIQPLYVVHKQSSQFYEKIYIMVPLCGSIVLGSIVLVAALLYCRRRKELLRIKENSNSLRRDITAETSLMNDLDKRFHSNLDSRGDTPDLFQKRNVNFLMSLNSDDNIGSPWFTSNNSKSTSDNGSGGLTDDDGNINPYATFNELKLVLEDCDKHKRNKTLQNLSDDDGLFQEKLAAQQAMDWRKQTPSEPYVPFFQNKESEAEHQNPPPLPANRPPRGYDNEGLILSPRKYASADQIHALFTSTSRPGSSHSKSKMSSRGSSDGQRHSVISSVTTVSSSRDELLEAFRNAPPNPNDTPVYEVQNDSGSQPTDSSVATEPGILMFTQSPPKPNEHREAACELPSYPQRKKRARRMEAESDTTEFETSHSASSSPRRRGRVKHRGRQRGQMVGKRTLRMGTFPRVCSGTSTTSTNSEEVTYMFGRRDSPSPSEGYLSLPCESRPFADSDMTYRRRGTCMRGHDFSLQTPGTDDGRPLVLALAPQGLSSPREEEEEAVSLLDRYYRPVQEEETRFGPGEDEKPGKGYTEAFTIV